jgi:hypothetical protein
MESLSYMVLITAVVGQACSAFASTPRPPRPLTGVEAVAPSVAINKLMERPTYWLRPFQARSSNGFQCRRKVIHFARRRDRVDASNRNERVLRPVYRSGVSHDNYKKRFT